MPDTAATKTAERLARIETGQADMRDDIAELRAYLTRVLDAYDVRLRCVEVKAVRLDERMGTVTKTLTFLQVVGSSIAAWIGVQK